LQIAVRAVGIAAMSREIQRKNVGSKFAENSDAGQLELR
jgi:hypothetical protein